MGRGLRRIVDMFYLPSDLVEAHDRSLDLAAEGNDEELSVEQVLSFLKIPKPLLTCSFSETLTSFALTIDW
jgi:hypothetical protein